MSPLISWMSLSLFYLSKKKKKKKSSLVKQDFLPLIPLLIQISICGFHLFIVSHILYATTFLNTSGVASKSSLFIHWQFHPLMTKVKILKEKENHLTHWLHDYGESWKIKVTFCSGSDSLMWKVLKRRQRGGVQDSFLFDFLMMKSLNTWKYDVVILSNGMPCTWCFMLQISVILVMMRKDHSFICSFKIIGLSF